MNYVLVSVGKIPEYIKFTLNSILSVDKDANIILCSDQKNIENFKNIKIIDIRSLNNNKVEEFKSLNLYKNTIFESNPLWETSALRVFYLESLKLNLDLEDIVHFDNDVLIYKPFEELKNNFLGGKFNITKESDKRFIFGYSYFSEANSLSQITKQIIELGKYGNIHNWRFNYGKPYSEMDFLGKIFSKNQELFHSLPVLPYNSNLVFDSSSYGQLLDGTHMHPKKFYSSRYINLNHYVGTEIMAKRIKFKFINNKPHVLWAGESFDIANLHIHSKRLDKFLPKNYKNYV